MLETTHQREYYLRIAEEYPAFEEVLTGDNSLVNWLDETVEHFGNGKELQQQAITRLETLCELYEGTVPSDDDMPRENLAKLFGGIFGYTFAGNFIPTAVGLTIATFVPPPFGPAIGATIMSTGPFAAIIAPYVGTKNRWERIKEKRREALEPLYCIMGEIDEDISRCFIYEDFDSDSSIDRFGEIYSTLKEHERKLVDSELHHMLENGLLDMGEIELENYLASLQGLD